MDLLNFVVIMVIVGVGLWLINTYVPMAQPIKTILNIVVILMIFIWVLQMFGFGHMYIGRH